MHICLYIADNGTAQTQRPSM